MRPIQTFVSKAVVLALSAAVVTCTTPADLVPVNSIQLQPANDSLELGETYDDWLVTLQDAGGNTLTGRPLTWESSIPEVLTIDRNSGVVTPVAPGTSIITVHSEGKKAQSTMKVILPILSIVVTSDSFDLPLTTSRTIGVQLIGPGGVAITSRLITWSSSNPGIAVVSGTGVVTAVSAGTTTITIRAGTKQADVRVRVVGEPVNSVRITPPQSVQVIRLGDSRQLSAECLSASQQVLTGRLITWNSGNPVIASVSGSGLVTGNSVGSASIAATCDNISATITIQVTLVPVSSVTISPTSLTLAAGTAGQLLATARDSAGNVLSLQNRQVVWTSNNIPVAQVSGQGVVSGGSAGTAEIQVSVDGIVSAPVTVSVTVPMLSDSDDLALARVGSTTQPARPAVIPKRPD